MLTPNGTQFQVATDITFTNKLVDYDGSYITKYTTPNNILKKYQTLYSRVRHSTVEQGYKDWSPLDLFSIKDPTNWINTSYPNASINTFIFSNFDEVIYHETYLYCAALNTLSNTSLGYICKLNLGGEMLWCKSINNLIKGSFIISDNNTLDIFVINSYEDKTYSYISLSLEGEILTHTSIVVTNDIDLTQYTYNTKYGSVFLLSNKTVVISSILDNLSGGDIIHVLYLDISTFQPIFNKDYLLEKNTKNTMYPINIYVEDNDIYLCGLYVKTSLYPFILQLDLEGNIVNGMYVNTGNKTTTGVIHIYKKNNITYYLLGDTNKYKIYILNSNNKITSILTIVPENTTCLYGRIYVADDGDIYIFGYDLTIVYINDLYTSTTTKKFIMQDNTLYCSGIGYFDDVFYVWCANETNTNANGGILLTIAGDLANYEGILPFDSTLQWDDITTTLSVSKQDKRTYLTSSIGTNSLIYSIDTTIPSTNITEVTTNVITNYY